LNLEYTPSFDEAHARVFTTTARKTCPTLTRRIKRSFLIERTIKDPAEALLLKKPSKTQIHLPSLAPVLSIISNKEPLCNIKLF